MVTKFMYFRVLLPKSIFLKVYNPPKQQFWSLTLQWSDSLPSFSQVAHNIATYFTVNMGCQAVFAACSQTSLLGCICRVHDNFFINILWLYGDYYIQCPLPFLVILFISFLSFIVYYICNLFKQHCFHRS